MLESITVVTLLLWALDRAQVQPIFDRDPYESRRRALPGSRLLKVLVFYQMIKSPKQRGVVRAIEQSREAQEALGGTLALNTLSNALEHSDLELMIEAWMQLLRTFGPWVEKLGRKFARVAVVDSSLIPLSLQAFDWAQYRKKTGAGKMHCLLAWATCIPQQLVFTAGKVHDLRAAVQLSWAAHWTYIFDRAYLGFDFLGQVLEAGAHFMVRFKDGVRYTILQRHAVAEGALPAGVRAITSDWTVSLPGWEGVILRLVSYQLSDGRLIRVLTSRHDLSALSVVQLYKERWTIEHWWRWIKQMFKIKEPLGRSESALPVQIVAAFVTDLLLRAFKHSSGFTGSLYEFVSNCQEVSLVPLAQLAEGALRRALEAVLEILQGTKRHLQLVA